MLNVFEPCTLQLGDKSFYNYKSSDLVLSMREWNQLQKGILCPTGEKTKSSRKKDSNYEEAEWETEMSSDDQACSTKTSSQNEFESKKLLCPQQGNILII